MQPINIYTEPIQVTNISECRITKGVNQHFEAVITGFIKSEEAEDSNLNTALKSPFIIKALSDGGEEILFRGTVCDIQIRAMNSLTGITIKANSNTVRMDKRHHTRTFQGASQTYRDLLDQVLACYNDASMIQTKGRGVQTDGLVVQYEETDWQFLKRLASRLHTVLVPDCTNDKICLYFGNPEKGGDLSFDMTEYRMRRYKDQKRGESVEYIIKSRENRELCERVDVKGHPCYIYQIDSCLSNQELEFEYTLRPSYGFETEEIQNEQLTGISVMGEVTAVSDTRVRAALFSEADFDFGNPLWFSFATVYTSPDGTGWYFMPEKGDKIRLFIPERDEQTAYAVSTVHVEDTDLRTDADRKFIRTKYDKEIRFTPDKILITNHKGMSIILDDSEGITIKSSRRINIASEHEVEIKGEQIYMEGGQGVLLMEGPNMLMVRDGIKEKGMNIEHR